MSQFGNFECKFFTSEFLDFCSKQAFNVSDRILVGSTFGSLCSSKVLLSLIWHLNCAEDYFFGFVFLGGSKFSELGRSFHPS